MENNRVKHPESTSRRKFFSQAFILGASLMASPDLLKAASVPDEKSAGDHYNFLFQGDSITDGNRSRDTDWNHVLGHGYAYLIASRLLFEFPKKDFHFYNRGISGNTVADLSPRWEEDAISLKPDLVSILIGINDTTHAVYGDKSFTAESFASEYRALLSRTKQQLPASTIVICEPFVLPAGKVKEKWSEYLHEITSRQVVARKLAGEFNAVYLPLQEPFNRAAAEYPPAEYWLWDGIHPMPNGHELIAREWLKQVAKKEKFIR